MILAALRDIFRRRSTTVVGPNFFDSAPVEFIRTSDLLTALTDREEEPWHRFGNGGKPITDEALATLLRPYKIKSKHSPDRTCRGYYKADFEDAWTRYLAPPSAEGSASA